MELNFTYSATLIGDETRLYDGSVRKSHWRTEHQPNEQTAAWAFVRGLLDVEGEWRCEVTTPDFTEHRTIDVYGHEEDEGLVRLDRKAR